MAKTGVFEGDPTPAMAKTKTTTDLKKELQRLVKSIVEESSSDEETGFGFTECIEKATRNLQDLKELKEGRTQRSSFASCPREFLCPISKELMKDPVIISTGKTYDRSSIQEWLKSDNRTCPKTGQILSHTVLTPNHLIRDIILQWCKNHDVRFPNPLERSDEHESKEPDRDLFGSLMKKMSSTLSDKKEAAKTLRSLTKTMPSFRAFFGESNESIPQLLTPLSQKTKEIDPVLQEDLITTLLNVSIHDSNKKLVAETPIVIPILINALKSGTINTRSNSAATLFTLSAPDSNKELIGKSGALKPLIDLLENGNSLAMKDAASAIFTLCINHENKGRAVRDGGIKVILHKIENRVHVDELLAILAMLSSNQKGIEDMCDQGAVSCLFSLIKETNCEKNKENCVAILHTICFNDRTKWNEMREEESKYRTLSQLSQTGTSRAKRKANGILDRLNRGIYRTHTA